MPTVLANALLSFVPDRSVPVRGRDRVAVVSPMFDEEDGAPQALASLLEQSEPFDEMAVSVNGGTDRTLDVVRETLISHGFTKVYAAPAPGLPATFERWYRASGPTIVLLDHSEPISKSHSINAVVSGDYLSSERILVVDGDTIFDRHFLTRLKDNFYRLRVERKGLKRRYVLEDHAIQSGAVTSLPPGVEKPVAELISRARAGEYAVAALLRAGQTARLGRGRMFGASRLYTVVGCGFSARSTSFPMPSDTSTEDHDFTLQVQNTPPEVERLDAAELSLRGFRVKVNGEEVDIAEHLAPTERVLLRRTGNARFVSDALMYTEDPPHLTGYMRQIERWNGGGLENLFKRYLLPGAARRLRPNVAFAVLASQFENVFGLLLLLLALPLALGFNFSVPGHGTALKGMVAWIGFDLVATLLLVGLGFRRLWRGQGARGWRLARQVTASTLTSAPALLSLRLLNAVSYVAAASRTLPAFIRSQRKGPNPWVTITWQRPRAGGRQLPIRAVAVASTLMVGNLALFAGAAYLGSVLRPGYKETWQLINAASPVRAEEHNALPLSFAAAALLDEQGRGFQAGGGNPPGNGPAGGAGERPEDAELQLVVAVPDPLGRPPLSGYCNIGYTAQPSTAPRLLTGDAAAYQPLTYWERLMLARLVPLAAYVEEAATAYDVPVDLLLRILINESALDPLAVGPTNDLGLSQVTTDALTMLREISVDPRSTFANPRFFAGPFNVFDPDFSICAGAAKLAWARTQPGGDDESFAYARYINPLDGVQRGVLNPVHAELVVAIEDLKPLSRALLNAFAMYRQDPARLTAQERELFAIYEGVAAGEVGLRSAYDTVGSLVERSGMHDVDLYRAVREQLFGMGESVSASLD